MLVGTRVVRGKNDKKGLSTPFTLQNCHMILSLLYESEKEECSIFTHVKMQCFCLIFFNLSSLTKYIRNRGTKVEDPQAQLTGLSERAGSQFPLKISKMCPESHCSETS